MRVAPIYKIAQKGNILYKDHLIPYRDKIECFANSQLVADQINGIKFT